MKAIEPHVHKYTRTATQKVALWHEEKDKTTDKASAGASRTGTDLLKLRVCECGKSQAYDLERTKA